MPESAAARGDRQGATVGVQVQGARGRRLRGGIVLDDDDAVADGESPGHRFNGRACPGLAGREKKPRPWCPWVEHEQIVVVRAPVNGSDHLRVISVLGHRERVVVHRVGRGAEVVDQRGRGVRRRNRTGNGAAAQEVASQQPAVPLSRLPEFAAEEK